MATHESHLITIIVTTLLAGVIAYFVIRKMRQMMQEADQKFKTIFNTASDGMFLLELQTKTFFLCNKACLSMTGYLWEEFKKLAIADLHPPEELPFIYQQVEKHKNGIGGVRRDIRFRRKDGSIFFADLSPAKITLAGKDYVLCIFKDIAERKKYEEKIWHLAHYDRLTGLPNRILFFGRFSQAITRAKRYKEKIAILALDLDKLKETNDVFGHQAGDCLLQETASRILALLRAEDTVARLGGDEFGIIIPEIKDAEAVTVVAEKIIQAIRQPIILPQGAGTIEAGISIGISIFPNHGQTEDKLLQRADAAMYFAKNNDKGNWRIFYEPLMGLNVKIFPPN